MILGIIGGIGAGKSTVVTMLVEQISCQVIGADEIGHRILLKGQAAYEPVIEAFGETILDSEGHIVRRELAKIVFSNKNQLEKLNQITHPIIFSETKKAIENYQAQGVKWIIIDAALLVEIGLVSLTDAVIGVYTEENIRIQRVMKREGFSEEEAKERINKQKKWEELEKVITYTINNNGDYIDTSEQVKKLIQQINLIATL